ncbi:hypothetical protein [Trichloromonas sp.]|uniref:cytochrome c3 family protein n=1 Tax=Trichloromonas sp. TaxID=3069249 RepID=UPI003D818D78
MKRVALLVSLLVALMTLACGKQEQAQAPEEKKAAETAAVAVPAPGVEKVEMAAQNVQQTTAAMAEKTAETAPAAVSQTAEKAAEMATATETTAQAMMEKAVEVAQNPTAAVEQAAETGKEAVVGAAAALTGAAVVAATDKTQAVSQTLSKTTQAVTQQAAGATEAATQTVAQASVATSAAAIPETIVIEASYGKVTLPHQMHADAFDCAACHGEGTPGALDLGKDKAHALCKGCHQEKAAGPTKCTGCHVK